MSLKKMCPGCGYLIDYNMKYCNECADKYKEKNKQRHRKYKTNRKDIKEQKFYISKPWLITRAKIKQRDKGLCRLCLAKGDTTYMDTVHHIGELKDCWDKKLTPSNLISLCESCHQEVHKEYLKGDQEKKEMQDTLRKIVEREGVSEKF